MNADVSATTTKRTPISAIAKKELRDYFTATNWPLNKFLPRGKESNLDLNLQSILNKHGLDKSQLARQLRGFKAEKYGNSQITIIINADELEEKMRLSLSMTTIDFVTSVLDRILAIRGQPSSTPDFEIFCKNLDAFPQHARTITSHISQSPTNECTILLSGLVDYWFSCAADKFPKTAMGLPDAEIRFQKALKEYKRTIFIPQWMEQWEAVCVSKEMEKSMFGRLGEFLNNTLFMEWSHLSAVVACS